MVLRGGGVAEGAAEVDGGYRRGRYRVGCMRGHRGKQGTGCGVWRFSECSNAAWILESGAGTKCRRSSLQGLKDSEQ